MERAKDALTAAVPGPRAPGAPLAGSVLAFEEELRAARASMDGWRGQGTEEAWEACAAALDESARLVDRLRREAPSLDFEGLVLVLADIIAPLDAFTDAAARVRRRGAQPSSRP